jgi:hypothetical protein
VTKRKLEKVDDDNDVVEEILQLNDSSHATGFTDGSNLSGDNRNYVDTNTAQKLDTEDILNMKVSYLIVNCCEYNTYKQVY